MTKRSFAMHAIHNAILSIALAGCIVPKPVNEISTPTHEPARVQTAYISPDTLDDPHRAVGCPPNPAFPVPATGKNLAIYASEMERIADACRAALGVTSGVLP